MAHFIKRATLVGAVTAVLVGLAFIAGTPGDANAAAAQPIAALTPTPSAQPVPTPAQQANACVIAGKTFETTKATPGDCRALDALRVAIPSAVWNFETLEDPCKLAGVTCYGKTSAIQGVQEISIAGRFAGVLPPEIGEFTSLRGLRFFNNKLTGNIPAEIGNLTSLTTLSISSERLSGPLPASIGSLTNLRNLTISQTEISDGIPTVIQSLTKLESLNLSGNNLSGEIPDLFASMPNLRAVDLNENDLSGPIPASLSKAPNLTRLLLANNKLSGELADDAFTPASGPSVLVDINLGRNQLSGQLPSSLFGPKTRSLFAQSNKFTGPLNVPEAGAPDLAELDLSSNAFSGEIPAAIFNNATLRLADLSRNTFTGSLPESLGKATGLTTLIVSNNELSGSLPEGISALLKLTNLQINNNAISGPLPSNTTKFSTVRLLPNGCMTTDDPAIRTHLARKGYVEPYGPCPVNDEAWGVFAKTCPSKTATKGTVTFRAANPSDTAITVTPTLLIGNLQYETAPKQLTVPPGATATAQFENIPNSTFTVSAKLNSNFVYIGTDKLDCTVDGDEGGGGGVVDRPVVVGDTTCLAATSRVDVELNNPGTDPVDISVKIGPYATRQASLDAGAKTSVSVYGLPDGPVAITTTTDPVFSIPDSSVNVTCTSSLTEPIKATASCMTGPAGISRGRVDVAIRNTSDLRSVFASALDLQLADGQVTRSSLRYQTLSSNELWKVVIPNLSNGTYNLSVLQNGVALDSAFTLDVACEGLPPAPDGLRVITSCLAGTARADVFIENTAAEAATYTASYGSAGVEKSTEVPAASKKRMVLFNTGDGLGPVNVSLNGTEVLSQPVTVNPCS